MEEELTLTQEWDKTSPKSDKVEHRKVTFHNRYGITLAADLYTPEGADGKLPAVAACGPFGAVEEQSSGLYAQTMAKLLEHLNGGNVVIAGSEEHKLMVRVSNEAMMLTAQLNNAYHTPEEVRELFSKIIGEDVDDSFCLFPPFYTDFGKNTHIGKNVFINSCCHFQDQGGVTVGDGCLIGHNVVLATINHDFDPVNANLKL